MTAPSNPSKNPVVAPLPDLNRLAKALSHPARWKMLKELTLGEARTIAELAAAGGCRYESARSHLTVLRRAGMVVQTRGRLYQLQKQHLPTPGEPVVDFGHCLLRLDAAG
jgi:DNA-binding transcriptional ArsR family regulator